MKSTQAMRDRIRELMTDPIDDYDRAVLCVLNELEHMLNEPQTAGLISREAADGIIEDMIYAWGIGKKYRESFKLDCERLLSSSVPRPESK